MKIKIRKDNRNQWSFVEEWNAKYKYSTYGVVKATLGVVIGEDGFLSVPMQYREEIFQPLSDVLERYSMGEWLMAKKPIYSPLGQGIIARFVVRYDLDSYKPDYENSHFEVYTPIISQATEEYVPLSRVFRVSSALEEKLFVLMHQLFEDSVTRSEFLLRRLEISEDFRNKENV